MHLTTMMKNLITGMNIRHLAFAGLFPRKWLVVTYLKLAEPAFEYNQCIEGKKYCRQCEVFLYIMVVIVVASRSSMVLIRRYYFIAGK